MKKRKEIKIRHIMADGRELQSIEGYTVPATNRIYLILGGHGQKENKGK